MTQGALTRVSSITLPTGCAPYGITSSPTNSNFVYVVSSGSTNPGIVQLAVNQTDGTLSQVGSIYATSNSPRRAVISPDGKHLYVTITGYDKINKFDINQTDGTLSNRVDYTGNAFCQYIAVSADGDHVYVANNAQAVAANGNIAVYLRNKTDGTLTLKQNFTLAYVWGVAVSKDGKGIYVSQTSGNLVALNRDTNTGSGTYGQILSTAGTYALPSNTNNAVAVTDDNLFVYVLSDGGAQYTEGFSRNTSNNTLSSIGHPASNADNNNGNWDIALSNDATQTALYSAISDGQEIAQYTRNPSTGVLTAMSPGSAKMSNYVSEPGSSSAGPYGIVVLKNNKYLLATTSAAPNAVDSFSIEQPTGTGTATITGVSATSAVGTIAASSPKATSLSLSLVDQGNNPQASLTGLTWAFFDQTDPGQFTAPSVKGSAGTTNASGVLTLNITGTNLSPGGSGRLVVSYGTKAFSGIVTVT